MKNKIYNNFWFKMSVVMFIVIIVIIIGIVLKNSMKSTENNMCHYCGYNQSTDSNWEKCGEIKVECDNKFYIERMLVLECLDNKWGEKSCRNKREILCLVGWNER